jgi:hypothetical protein
VQDRTGPCDTLVCISVGVDVLFLIEVLNFMFDRKELISLIVLPKSLISISHTTNQGAMQCQRLFDVRDTLTMKKLLIKLKIKWSLNRHILRCRVVKCTQGKLNSV